MQQIPEEKCLILSGLPEGIKAYEIYPQIMSQLPINILSLDLRSKTQKEGKLSPKEYYSKIEEEIVKPSKYLVTQTPKLQPNLFQKVAPEKMAHFEKNPGYYGLIKGESTLHDTRKEEPKEFDPSATEKTDILDFISSLVDKNVSDSCLAVVYDKRSRIDQFLTKDIVLYKKMITVRELPEEETKEKSYFYQTKTLYFPGYYYEYEYFEAGTILNPINENEKPVFRKYWGLKEIEDVKLSLRYRKIFFNFKSPENASLASLLNISLLFQVQGQMEMRVSLDMSRITIYKDNDRVYWVIHLVKHPACYFYPLTSHQYKAFHIKNWRRIPNFLVHAIPDNIDKIYLASKTCVRLSFKSKYYGDKSNFFKAYEDRLKALGKLERIESASPYNTVKYGEMSLKLCTPKIEEPKMPFEIKFLVMVMISRGQIDAYDLPEDFIDKLMRTAAKFNDDKTIVKRAIEFMALNKDYDNQFMSYGNFKKQFGTYLETVKSLEKIMSTDTMRLNRIPSFDDSFYNFELQVTPSCIYYTCGDLSLPKTIIYEFSDCIENFVHVKLIDENLKPIKAARRFIGHLFYSKFFEDINILKRKYQFFWFSLSQIQSRSFWVYNSETSKKPERIHAYLESLERSSFPEKNENPEEIEVIEYITKMTNQPNFSYDILDLKNDQIEIIKISSQEASKRNVRTNADTQSKILRPISYDGFISGDLLDKISHKFNYGNIPGLILHCAGKDFVVIRDSTSSQESCIRFYEDVYLTVKGAQKFKIVEIIRYKPAFLNRQLILLLDSFLNSTKFSYEEYKDFEHGMWILLSKFSYYMSNKDINFCKRMTIYSKHGQLERVLGQYENFSQEPYFFNLTNSILFKANVDLCRKMKINTEFGVELMGIIDDSGNVKKDEIYYNIDNPIQRHDYNENDFPFVLVTRKPHMDLKDIRYFKVDNKRFSKNTYKELKNCIVFSKDDKEFVLGNSLDSGPVKKVNRFLLLWDQNFIPYNFRKNIYNNESGAPLPKRKLSKEEAKNVEDSDFPKEEIHASDCYESEITQSDSQSDAPNHNLKFNKFKNKMKEHFISLIKVPRLKDMKLLHLVHFDVYGSKDELAQQLSIWYKKYSVTSLFSEEEAVEDLLMLLESSIYLRVPFYLKGTGCLQQFETQSLLGNFYKAIQPNIFSESSTESNLINPNAELKIDPELFVKGFEKHIKNGLKVLLLYKYDIQKLCFLFGCSSESDLLIGFSRNMTIYSEDYEIPSFKREYINLKDYVRNLIQKYIRLFYHAVQKEQADAKQLIVASAWYACSLYELWEKDENLKIFKLNYRPLLEALNQFKIKQVYGLPWFVAGKILKKIKKDHQSSQNQNSSSERISSNDTS